MLSVKNLHASVDGKEILRGIDLEVKAGEDARGGARGQ